MFANSVVGNIRQGPTPITMFNCRLLNCIRAQMKGTSIDDIIDAHTNTKILHQSTKCLTEAFPHILFY